MRVSLFTRLLLLLTLLPFLAGCNLPALNTTTKSTPSTALSSLPIAEPLPSLPETVVNFKLIAPGNTAIEEIVYLSVLDEVTGLALNAKNYPMQLIPPPDNITGTQVSRIYILSLPMAIGSLIQYRYERQSGDIRVGEHTADGTPVRYRLFHVEGPATVEDVVSSWTDTTYTGSTGRIMGQATDAATGQPIPSLLVTAGGAQAITRADGSFLLEGLPPGVHNLVTFSLDGAYQTYQQGARIAPESTTPAPLKLAPAQLIKVIFVVSVPQGTLPVIPVRLTGNLYQLGNTFATLSGGVSSLALNMPVLSALPDGRYTLTLSLPVDADIRYKYTLGDGFWNAEHTSTGEFRLRQIVIPNHNVLVEDKIESWYVGAPNAITFDVTVPPNTPIDDFIAIQFNPVFGWTEPIPMWSLGNNRWAYILYSPLNLPGNFNYRYCRNSQCGYADDALTPGLYGQGRPVKISTTPQIIKDQVPEWASFFPTSLEIPTAEIEPRGVETWAGVEFLPNYHPSWRARLSKSLDNIQEMGANWLVLSPTWTFGLNPPGNTPPVLENLPGPDMSWFDLLNFIQAGRARNLNIALNPTSRFLVDSDEWWQSAPRDYSWWVAWFDQFHNFALHHANLAARSGASALILGGDWLDPALPGGKLADGSTSNVPSDAEQRWRDMIAGIRAQYQGKLLWAMTPQEVLNPPAFLNMVDGVYLLWSLPAEWQTPNVDLEKELAAWLDSTLKPFQASLNKPLILSVTYPASPDLQTQYDAYRLLLLAVNSRSWISGFVTRDYYPPAALTDQTASVNGKPSSDLLGYWFPRWLGQVSP